MGGPGGGYHPQRGIRLPFLGALFVEGKGVLPQDEDTSGLHSDGQGRFNYISPGLGSAGFPGFRFYNPPTLSVITLNQKNLDNSKKSTVKQDLTIITPSGAPALSLLGAINNQDINLNYEVVDGSDVLTAEFTNAEKDMIIAPVNLGVKLIEKGADYKLLGVVTWGNLYIVSSQNLYTSIAAFGEAAVPGKVLNYVKDLIGPNVTIEYYSSVQEAASMLLSGNTNAALLAEPVLTKTAASFKENNPDNSLI